jgi:hypothetical protein
VLESFGKLESFSISVSYIFMLAALTLMAQILSAQIYTTADEIPSFPGFTSF